MTCSGYCSDTFDENTPPVDDPEYISSLGAAIFKGMQSGDADAVWLMQVKESPLLLRGNCYDKILLFVLSNYDKFLVSTIEVSLLLLLYLNFFALVSSKL